MSEDAGEAAAASSDDGADSDSDFDFDDDGSQSAFSSDGEVRKTCTHLDLAGSSKPHSIFCFFLSH